MEGKNTNKRLGRERSGEECHKVGKQRTGGKHDYIIKRHVDTKSYEHQNDASKAYKGFFFFKIK